MMTTERISLDQEFVPSTNGELRLPKEHFMPNPSALFQDVVDKGIGGTRLATLHGSYVYLDEAPLNRTYHETRVYKSGIFQGSEFSLVKQPPDVDVVAVVESLDTFSDAFLRYIQEQGVLNNLNHFIEMTVLTEDVLRQEVNRADASGMKTVFGLKPLIGIGDTGLMESIRTQASANIQPTDVEFQDQYELRKSLYRMNGADGVENFTISRKQYEQDFPAMLSFYDTGSTSAFPQERIKLTLPKPLKLRSWKHYDENWQPIDTSKMKIND